MPAQTRAATLAQIANLIPDNEEGAITPAHLRTVLRTITDSAVFPEDEYAAPPATPTPTPSDFNADFSADFGASAGA
ncbi:hypothetical protein [Oceanicella actignis]|uniref:Uncharacterized protein n=1 Tax=Oceanicella actignis TaxID=1189325 RepID=A0A1M7U1U0_9RHOB|nr:hypothetical protein [Oceanicella actignis]SES77129.1 hypothetical protein SAMN04488119_101414 [Oceanicella actignis]SHN76837.1 hypothetical protein SAMN05216200_1148 [Oceanicella actignis]